jgi:pyruvate/2-oxoglutarate/acetoin dehydrogenase E1 component
VLAEAGSVAQAGEFAVPLCVRVPYGTEAPGHDIPIGGWLLHTPGVRVVCPSTPAQLAAWLSQATRGTGPIVLLESTELQARKDPGDGEPATEAQLSQLHQQGAHVTLAAVGDTVEAALGAAEELRAEGIEAEVLELVSLAPLDVDALGASVRRTGRLVVVHPSDPALAQHVRQAALEQAFWSLEAPLGEAAAISARAVADAVLDIIRA